MLRRGDEEVLASSFMFSRPPPILLFSSLASAVEDFVNWNVHASVCDDTEGLYAAW